MTAITKKGKKKKVKKVPKHSSAKPKKQTLYNKPVLADQAYLFKMRIVYISFLA